MADLANVQQTIRSVAASSGAKNLTARQNGNLIEIHGRVRTLAEKQSVMYAITQAVGDTDTELKNMITVSSDMSEFSPEIGREQKNAP